jgi:hypothetical protein
MTDLMRTYQMEAVPAEPLPAMGVPPLQMVLVHLMDEPIGAPGEPGERAAAGEQTEAEEAALRLIVRLIEHFDKQV